MIEITEHTAIWGILAGPAEAVEPPQGLHRLMERRHVDGVLFPLVVAPEDLGTLVAGLKTIRNFRGFIVNAPHKSAAVAFCDQVTLRAKATGAVNAIRREPNGQLIGDILDGAGFLAGLQQFAIELAERRVFLAGAGATASAIAFALADAGIAHLTISNRTTEKAESLKERLASHFPSLTVEIGTLDASGHDIVINATALGRKISDPLPVIPGRLSRDQIIADVITQPEMTALLSAARGRGCRIHPGKPMLAWQLELLADFIEMHARADDA
ncbi:MAG: shikimate dehydrogenase [Alphaproteobacteria bacterium]|nr:shikimate dehydrogenase [Alphaproteobacteria bacterium]